MISSPAQVAAGPAQDTRRISGSSEMAERIRAFNWASHPLGAIASWPETLLTTVNMMLAAPVAMQLFWGPEFFVFYNDAAMPVLAGKHPQALGQPARICWAEAWSTVGPQMESVRATGEAVNFNGLMVPVSHNGVMRDAYWNYSYSAVLSATGEREGVLDIFSDVTEAVEFARARREADERLQLALEGAGLGMWYYDADTGNVIGDERMHRIFGASSETGSPSFWLDLLHPEDSSRVEQHFQGALAGKHSYDIEYRIVRPDGMRWIRSMGRFFHVPGKAARLAAIVEDITARKEMEGVLANREQQLRVSEGAAIRSEEQLQNITDSLPSYISYLDPQLRYLRVNRTYEEWFRRPASEIIGRTIDEVLGEEAASKVRPHLLDALKGKRKHFDYKLTTFGEDRFLSVAHIPDFARDGTLRGVIIQGQDITELKRSEQALLQTEKLAAVGRLAASIAHEINNPLESVTNLLFLARNATELTEIQDYLDMAERELRRVSVISNQTLRFYRQSTRPRAVTCRDLIDSVLSVYAGRLLNSGVEVEHSRCLHDSVECFDGEIRQVLNNLVGNAIDAMHPGGGRLTIRSRPATDWPTKRTGVVITVADTGTGMSLTVLQNIFQAFYTTKGIGGTGLGLWVSKEIVDRHEGRVRVRSSQRLGATGTVFTLFLPSQAALR